MVKSLKIRLAGFAVLLFAVSLACNVPFGLDLQGTEDRAEEAAEIIAQMTPSATPTITPTPTNTAPPTDTPEPTPTATLVVQPTSTPTAVSGAAGAAAPGGGGQIAPAGGAGAAPTSITPLPAAPAPGIASTANVIVNGSFEDNPWPEWQGIAPAWSTFDNGNAHVGWYKDTWHKVVYDGERAQLIEIIADRGEGNRYAGIFQTVSVVPNAKYELTIHGLVRSDEGSSAASGSGYILQYGIDFNGGSDWRVVPTWVDLPFPEHPREDPKAENVYNYGAFTTSVTPTGNKLTLFIRGWKKWTDTNEGNFDVDAIALRGISPGLASTPIPQMPVTGDDRPMVGPPVAILFFSLLSILILVSGAIVGLVKRRSAPEGDFADLEGSPEPKG